jgi:chemotaxis signal transduction protein
MDILLEVAAAQETAAPTPEPNGELALVSAAPVLRDLGSVATRPAASARLLRYERGRRVALPLHTTLELLDQAVVVEVPGSMYYCNGLTRWQGEWLQVIDLHALLNAYRKDHAPRARYVLVVAYQPAPRQPLRHGAIALPSMPETVQVNDQSTCALPTDSDLWPLISLACFKHDGREVPILDTARLFQPGLG